VSEVLQEVRDSKARFYLETFPHEIIEKRPSPAAVAAGMMQRLYLFVCFSIFAFRALVVLMRSDEVCAKDWRLP
jgi:hypothetical protein